MAVTPFPKPSRQPSDAAAKLAEARALLAAVAEEGTPQERRAAKKMQKADTRPTGGYMRLWDAREREIEEDLEADAQTYRDAGKPVPVGTEVTLGVLRAARNTMGASSQRMERTQAQIATERGLTAAQASLAFAALARVGAVLAKQPKARSITWEIDARYASRLNDDALRRAIEAQDAWRDADARNAKKQAALDAVGHRVLPWPARADEGRTEDERQPELLK